MFSKQSFSRFAVNGIILASGLAPVVGTAGTVAVDGVTQRIAAPIGAPGISYATNGPNQAVLKVFTEGFLFCGNAGTPSQDWPTSLHVMHQMIDGGVPHVWALPTESDVQSVSYRDGNLAINTGLETTLNCLGTAADGAIASAMADAPFDNGFDSGAETNYRHLLNFAPQQGFDFSNPNWSEVPTDPCANAFQQPPLAVENIACAAVTGAKPGTGGAVIRDGKLWTYMDGTSFVYVVRVDAHLGAAAQEAATMALPAQQREGDIADGAGTTVYVQDAFDGSYLSGAANSGQYCLLTTLPNVLNTSVCANSVAQPLPNGTLKTSFNLPQPNGENSSSFYIAVIRAVSTSPHLNLTTPVIAVSAMLEPALAAEGGDNFIGDNVVFGFMPASQGFPWMTGGN